MDFCKNSLTRKGPFTKNVVFVASVGQDVKPDLRSTLSAILGQYMQMIARIGICHYLCLIVGLKYPLGLFGALRVTCFP